jgi:hypothetical protein
MGKRILIFNAIYYGVILFFVMLGMDDPSSSLGYGFFIMGFFVIAAIVLAILLVKKIIFPRSIAHKIGLITATPVPSIVTVYLILALGEGPSSEQISLRQDAAFRVKTVFYQSDMQVKRIEYYRSPVVSPRVWERDSTWLFFSEDGDTIQKVTYRNGKEVESVR